MGHVCGVDAGDRVGGGGHAFLVGDEDDPGHRAFVAAVGRMWGLSDASHFARRFRAACGNCITGARGVANLGVTGQLTSSTALPAIRRAKSASAALATSFQSPRQPICGSRRP
jgi:hypothetical protein